MNKIYRKLMNIEKAIKTTCIQLENLETTGNKYSKKWQQNMEILNEAIQIEEKYKKQLDTTNMLTKEAKIIRNPLNYIIRENIEDSLYIEEMQKRVENLLAHIGYTNITTVLQTNFVNKEEYLMEIVFEIIKQERIEQLKKEYEGLEVLLIDEEDEKDISEYVNEAVLTGSNIADKEDTQGLVIETFNKNGYKYQATKRKEQLKEEIIRHYLQGDIRGLMAQEIDDLIDNVSYSPYIVRRLVYKKYHELYYPSHITNNYMIKSQNIPFKDYLYSIFGLEEVEKNLYKIYEQNITKMLMEYLNKLLNSFPQFPINEEEKLYNIITNTLRIKVLLLLIKEKQKLIENLEDTIETYISINGSNKYLSTFYIQIKNMCEELKKKKEKTIKYV